MDVRKIRKKRLFVLRESPRRGPPGGTCLNVWTSKISKIPSDRSTFCWQRKTLRWGASHPRLCWVSYFVFGHRSTQEADSRPCCNPQLCTTRPSTPLSRDLVKGFASAIAIQLFSSSWALQLFFGCFAHSSVALKLSCWRLGLRRGITGAVTWQSCFVGEQMSLAPGGRGKHLKISGIHDGLTCSNHVGPSFYGWFPWFFDFQSWEAQAQLRAISPVTSPRWWRIRMRPWKSSLEARCFGQMAWGLFPETFRMSFSAKWSVCVLSKLPNETRSFFEDLVTAGIEGLFKRDKAQQLVVLGHFIPLGLLCQEKAFQTSLANHGIKLSSSTCF